MLDEKFTSDNLLLTDENDIELTILCSDTPDRFIAEYGSPEKVTAIQNAKRLSIRDILIRSASTIGTLLLLSKTNEWNLDFKEMTVRFAGRDDIDIDVDRQIEHLRGRSPGTTMPHLDVVKADVDAARRKDAALLAHTHRWSTWAAPKKADGSFDHLERGRQSHRPGDLRSLREEPQRWRGDHAPKSAGDHGRSRCARRRKRGGAREHQGSAMKKGWEIKRLSDVCEFDKMQGVHRGLPYVGLEDIESHTARFIGSSEPVAVKSSTFRFSADHVLYGRLRPYLNKVLAPDFDGHCSTEIFPIKPGAQLSRDYLLYWLLADETVERINATCTGARMPRADMKDVLEFDFPLPPLPEQQRIVDILDEAFDGLATAKANAEKNLQNARALFGTFLNSVFMGCGSASWPKRRLGEVFEIGSSKRIHEREWTSSGVPFYGGKEIVKLAKQGHAVSNAYISEEKYREYASRYDMPRAGDILITARGTIGVGYVVRKTDKFYYKDGNVISMRPKEPANPHYLLYAFRSDALAKQLGDLSGTTVKHLPLERAKELLLMMPRFDVQNSLTERIENFERETERLESIYQQKLDALAALKKSLLHEAFSGQL
jgi:type I restriction enzyme S subunit